MNRKLSVIRNWLLKGKYVLSTVVNVFINGQTAFPICLAASVPLQFEKKTQDLHGSFMFSADGAVIHHTI